GRFRGQTTASGRAMGQPRNKQRALRFMLQRQQVNCQRPGATREVTVQAASAQRFSYALPCRRPRMNSGFSLLPRARPIYSRRKYLSRIFVTVLQHLLQWTILVVTTRLWQIY